MLNHHLTSYGERSNTTGTVVKCAFFFVSFMLLSFLSPLAFFARFSLRSGSGFRFPFRRFRFGWGSNSWNRDAFHFAIELTQHSRKQTCEANSRTS